MPERIKSNKDRIIFNDLTMVYGSFVVQRNLTFGINRGEISENMEGSTNGLIHCLSRV